mmetsp:Transcript_7910/g.33295  ORF Transcript_7910/g.33295 Transcript_7910/m.33295 type:complete len:218 (+) Transcript_7910:883-1536(+)
MSSTAMSRAWSSVTEAPNFFTAAMTTASFSMGFMEHVEYTSLPPSSKRCSPRRRMRTCFLWRPSAKESVQLLRTAGVLRRVPSPLHGTSASTREKRKIPISRSVAVSLSSSQSVDDCGGAVYTRGKLAASPLVTSTAGEARRLRNDASLRLRSPGRSLATKRKASSMPALSWRLRPRKSSAVSRVLLPGEAHMSSTAMPLLSVMSRSNGGSSDAISW